MPQLKLLENNILFFRASGTTAGGKVHFGSRMCPT